MTKKIAPARYISVKDLVPLERNPRTIKDARFKILIKNIKEHPDFFEDRPCLVNNASGKNVIYAGNMRFHAAVKNGIKAVPCKIRTLTKKEEKFRTVSDNVELGEWDVDMLANEWDGKELAEWGVELAGVGDEVQPEDVETVSSGDALTECPKCGHKWKAEN